MTRPPAPPDDDARRAYWTAQMEAAWDMMERCRRYPVADCGEPLSDLRRAAAEAKVPLAFSDTPVLDGVPRLFYLRAGLVPALLAAARAAARRGWVLKLEDGYRTRAIQTGLGRQPAVFDLIYRRCAWEIGGRDLPVDFMFRRLTALVATRPTIGTHMSGSALDLSVIEAGSGREVDRGGPYVDLSERAPMASPFVSAAARRNRETITALLADAGFRAYPFEFWHYSQGDVFAEVLAGQGVPARYGAVDADPPRDLAVTPLAAPDAPLHAPAHIAAAMEAARARETRRGAEG